MIQRWDRTQDAPGRDPEAHDGRGERRRRGHHRAVHAPQSHGPQGSGRHFPPIEVPEAVDAGDPFENFVDQTLEAGMQTVDDLVKALGEQGRRRHLR